ncbi:MAG: hypothetical protein QNJ00_11480 [Woeseiaceae bacterium]|nr:hypothetical protein [Woeseiaceae bacterium]
MTTATRKDILDVFPGLQDHALVEILEMNVTIEDLEATLAVMTSDDEDLIDVKQRESARIHGLLRILSQEGIEAPGRDR